VSGRAPRQRQAERPVPPHQPAAPPPPLYVPRSLVRDTHDAFLPYWRAGVEVACYWFGLTSEQVAVATTVALPCLEQSSGHYRVDGTSLRRLATEMRAQGLVNLAQIHTHPAAWVGHSVYDDEHAYSTRTGALSLVWPDYGCCYPHDLLRRLGVHERQDGRWVHLSEDDAARRIKLVDSVADYRWDIVAGEGAEDA